MFLFINRSALEGSFTIPLQDNDPSLSSGYLDIHKSSYVSCLKWFLYPGLLVV